MFFDLLMRHRNYPRSALHPPECWLENSPNGKGGIENPWLVAGEIQHSVAHDKSTDNHGHDIMESFHAGVSFGL